MAAQPGVPQNDPNYWENYARSIEQGKIDADKLVESLRAEIKVLREELYTCPECQQGKHVNCTFNVLNSKDEFVPCGCRHVSHD